MSSALYDKGRQKFLDGSIAWSSDTIKVVLIHVASYTVNLATDEFLSDVPVGARVATSSALTTKTSTAGVADADDVSYLALTGSSVEALVIYKDTGVAGTSPLIAYIDSTTGLPATPSGSDWTISWSNGSSRIFKL